MKGNVLYSSLQELFLSPFVSVIECLISVLRRIHRPNNRFLYTNSLFI